MRGLQLEDNYYYNTGSHWRYVKFTLLSAVHIVHCAWQTYSLPSMLSRVKLLPFAKRIAVEINQMSRSTSKLLHCTPYHILNQRSLFVYYMWRANYIYDSSYVEAIINDNYSCMLTHSPSPFQVLCYKQRMHQYVLAAPKLIQYLPKQSLHVYIDIHSIITETISSGTFFLESWHHMTLK